MGLTENRKLTLLCSKTALMLTDLMHLEALLETLKTTRFTVGF